MQRLVDLAREREFVLVHDFAYADIAFDGHVPPSVLAAEGALDCAVELYSLTKSFSMAGWRMGFTLGRPDVVAALAKLKSLPRLRHLPADPDRLDRGAPRGLRLPARGLRDLPPPPRRADLRPRRARAGTSSRRRGRCSSGRRSPSSTRELGSLEFALKLAREADVAVSPGIGFGPGGDGHVRFALVENEQRIGQATRSIRQAAPGQLAHDVTAPSDAEPT